MIVYLVKPEGFNSVVENKVENIIEFLKNSEQGDVWRIEVLEMSVEEYNNLPEFEGF